MGARRIRPSLKTSTEFELDLAPLLAVVVKLVPVLLISSAFVQMMVIESDVPQAVKEVIEKNKDDEKLPKIKLYVSLDKGSTLVVENVATPVEVSVPMISGAQDLKTLQVKFQEIKTKFPEVYRLQVYPEKNIPYQDIVRIMDEARKSRNKELSWPVRDKVSGQDVRSSFMFPDVVFGNILDG